MKFNPGIEGLRGVAILLVVLAHAGVPGLAAGFIGVDVFFVISGFLITGLLTEELERTGRVDLWRFYARRARRLAPALLVMVLVMVLVVFAFVPRLSWDLHLDSAFWSLLWSSNIYFTFVGLDYFGPSASESLFLHTWSLGVEEQFYLVWPVLLAWAWVRGGVGWRWLGLLAGVGFVAGLVLLWVDANAAYFLMPSRLWQLAVGAMAWRLGNAHGESLAGKGWLLGCGGLVLVAASLWVIDPGQTYPGWPSLLPTLGSMLLLLAVTKGASNLPAVLSSPLQLAGRVSYSWYLWHWPLLMLPAAMGWGAGSAEQRMALVLMSFLVALASLVLVEQPVRKGTGWARTAVLACVAVSLVAACAVRYASDRLAPGLLAQRSLIEARIQQDITVPRVYARSDCDQWYHSDQLVPCEYAPAGPDAPVVVFIGDSVGAQWLPAIERFAEDRGLRLVILTKSSCPMVDEPLHYPRLNRVFTECEAWRASALEHIRELRPAWVVMGSSRYDYSAQQWREGTRRILSSVHEAGARAVILAPTPILDFHVPRCLATSARVELNQLVSDRCTQSLAEVDPAETIHALREAARAVPGSAVLYLNDHVCPAGLCRGLVSGRVTYRDAQHLNASYVEDLAPVFQRRLLEALRGPGDQ